MEVALALAGVRTMLVSAPAVTAITDDIFVDLAPPEQPYPFVVISLQSSTDTYGVGPTRIFTDCEVLVRGYMGVDSYEPLSPLADAIDAAMSTVTASTTAGVVLSARRIRPYAQLEEYEAGEVRALGGLYRIFAQGA
jgi:hypothetical protein